MSDINFLDNKRRGETEKLKGKDDKKEKLVWSNPEKEAASPKNSVFSFLPFFDKKKPADKKSVLIIDKNKIKRSRKEILNLIKRRENSKSALEAKSKNFLKILGEKLKTQPAPKEILIDYQQIFNREKEHKEQIGKVFNVKPALKAANPAGARARLWLSRLSGLFKSKRTAPNIGPGETARIIKPPQAEKKPVEAKEIKFKEPEPIHKNESGRRIFKTNLIQGELVTFFDWRSKIIVLVGAILMPLAVVGAVYYGLVFYQKSSQAKNLAQAKKLAEFEQSVIKEEADAKEISAFRVRLKIVSEIFEQHLYWTNFFKFLEDNTIKDVYFTNFNGDTGGNYALDASAANYGNIAEQVKVFRNNKKVASVLVNGGELAAGDNLNQSLVKFILNFSVLKSIFIE